MREIKFRAWYGQHNVPQMVEFSIPTVMPTMQYTGLKDKNGKEIYEGDIVKIYNYKETWKHQEPPIDWRVFEIKWNRYLWQLNNSYISRPLADYGTKDLEPWEIEVIGNIYENPELLK